MISVSNTSTIYAQLNTTDFIKKISSILVVCLMVFCLAACNHKSNQAILNSSNTKSGLSIKDSKKSASIKVLTPDWGIAAELMGMGHPPVATGDIRMYKDWTGTQLPPDTHDLGIRFQPNPELMAQLDVDLVIDNFFYEHIRPMYGDIPAESLLLMVQNDKSEDQRVTWEDYAKLSLQLGELIKQPKDAKSYVDSSEKKLVEAGQKFKKRYPKVNKLAVVQFADVNNLRMYASNSLYQPTFNKMGLELVTFDDGNKWGFVNLQLGDLNKLSLDTCLIIVKPFSEMLKNKLYKSILWHKMGYGKNRCVAIADPVWMYGGIASMTSFANHLLKANLYGGNITKADVNFQGDIE